MMSDTNPVWWKNAVAYQVYWRSFAGGGGDGHGDCAGVISKMDYLQGLGIDLVWLTPMFPSPMVDSGKCLDMSASDTIKYTITIRL
jgi:hypothetical protein